MSWKYMEDTHYKALGIPEESSPKEIKDAFRRLSLLTHPDRNPEDKNLHDKFVRVSEAYDILGKPESRRQYDSRLRFYRGFTDFGPNAARHKRPVEFRDPSIWSMRDKSQDWRYERNKNAPPYGIKGIPKVSNGWIAFGCVVFMCMGTFFQLYAVKYNVAQQARFMDERSAIANVNLQMARRRADELATPENQIENFKLRYETDNPRRS